MAEAANKTFSVKIEGRVQGVYYRAWTEQTARALGLDGTVRNASDGSVEAVFSGPADKVDEMLRRCADGPPDARVTRVSVTKEGGSVSPGFSGCLGPIGAERPKRLLECGSKRPIHALHVGVNAERGEAGDWRVQPARHDAGEMLQIRIDVEADAVEAHPMADTDADARDLGLADKDSDRPSRRSPLTPSRASAAMSQSSSAWTKARTSRPRRPRSSITYATRWPGP